MTRKPNCACKVCGKPVYRRPFELERSNGNAYCSQACFGRSSRKPRCCPVCKKDITAQRDRQHCSRACANIARTGMKYRQHGVPRKDKAKSSQALKLRLLLARGEKCERCGYSNQDILVVHHIVRRSDGSSDDLENLELVCPNCHAEIHFYGVKHSKKGSAKRHNGGVAELG